MPRFFVMKPRTDLAPQVPDAFTVHDDGSVVTHRTGLVVRGFADLALAMSAYGLTADDLDEVDELPRFSQRP